MPCLMFAVCMALRLARFNAALDGAPKPAYAYNFFTGVPAPAGAGLALFPLFLGLEAKSLGWSWLLSAAQYPAVLRRGAGRHGAVAGFHPAGLELQELQGARRIRAAAAAGHRASSPHCWWPIRGRRLAAGGLIYLVMLPFSVRSFRRLRREAEGGAGDADEADQATG